VVQEDAFSVRLGRASVWRPGAGFESGRGVVLGDLADDALLWLDFYKPRATIPAPYFFDVESIADALRDVGVGGGDEVARLVERRHTDAVGRRRVNVVTGFGVERGDEYQLAAADVRTMLVAVAVTVIALPRCVVTVRHRPVFWIGRPVELDLRQRIYEEGSSPRAEPFATRLQLHDPVGRRWTSTPGARSSGDLAQLILAELSATLDPAVGYLSRALEFAEHRYFAIFDTPELDEAAMVGAQRGLFELARLLAEFGRAIYFYLAWTPEDTGEWFDDVTSTEPLDRIREQHEEAQARVRSLIQDVRVSVDMMASTVASRQLVIAHRQEERAREQMLRNERFMRDATLVASLVLLPTLIATIYGANVALPFKNEVGGALLLVAAMAIGAALAWLAIRRRD
jgi:Mg2+ and Co2+ transporter CorA